MLHDTLLTAHQHMHSASTDLSTLRQQCHHLHLHRASAHPTTTIDSMDPYAHGEIPKTQIGIGYDPASEYMAAVNAA